MKGGGRQNLPDSDDGLHQALKASMDDAQLKMEKQRIMDQTLSDLIPPDFYLQKVSGDGNCLFRAISRSFRDITGTFHHHMDLRHRCVSNLAIDQSSVEKPFC